MAMKQIRELTSYLYGGGKKSPVSHLRAAHWHFKFVFILL